MFRVGIVGCGSIGKVHAIALNKENGLQLCAMADIQMERAKAYSEQFTDGEAGVYGSLAEMLEAEQLDVLHICTPHVCHVPMAVMALKRGIHVFMEKPPAISREQFEELKQVSHQGGGRLGVCFQNRYNETTTKVSELLAEGKLGRILCGRGFVTWHRTEKYYTESGWRGMLATEGGGVLINQSVHTLDLLLMWLGKPLTVDATMCNHHLKGKIEVEDTLEAYLTFSEEEEPVRASFYATNAYGTDEPVLIELNCEHGFVRLEGEYVWFKTEDMDEPVLWKAPHKNTAGKAYWGAGHEACIQDYYQCLESGKTYCNDLDAVENTFSTMMDIYESARQNNG